jgi:hypothetical protein
MLPGRRPSPFLHQPDRGLRRRSLLSSAAATHNARSNVEYDRGAARRRFPNDTELEKLKKRHGTD